MLDEDMDEDCELEDKKERGAIEYLNYEGDGIFDTIYEVLWTKQEGGKGIDIVVPDTVVFKFNKPTGWYYTKITKSSALRLHKKRTSALRMGLILQHFQRMSASCCSDIVAYYISQTELDAEQHQRTSKIHYLARDELEQFLLHTKNKSGILQRFVDPKPSTSSKFYNSLVRCTWSQSVCLVERRANVHDLKPPKVVTQKNPRLSRYDRAETFEGDFRNSNEYPLTSAKLLEQIQGVCQKIVDHFNDVACQRLGINRMVVNFKFDSDTRAHFLWCESLRLERRTHPVTGEPLAPPPTVIGGDQAQAFNLANKLQLPPRDMQGQDYTKCRMCAAESAVRDFVKVSYHTLLAAHDEIRLTNRAQSARLAEVRARWARVEQMAKLVHAGHAPTDEQSLRDRHAVRPWSRTAPQRRQPAEVVDTGVAIDETSFTTPMNTDRGLLAHVDERQLLKEPLAALAQAAREWEERHKRAAEAQPQVGSPRTGEGPRSEPGSPKSPAGVPDYRGIPWFVRHLHPYITRKDWLHVRGREDFLQLSVSMCDSCFVTLVTGLSSEDTLRRFHGRISRRPRLSRSPPPLFAEPRSPKRELEEDPAPQKLTRKLHGMSRLLIPCSVRFTHRGVSPIQPVSRSPATRSFCPPSPVPAPLSGPERSPCVHPDSSPENQSFGVKTRSVRLHGASPRSAAAARDRSRSPPAAAQAAGRPLDASTSAKPTLQPMEEGVIIEPFSTVGTRRRRRKVAGKGGGGYCRSALLHCIARHSSQHTGSFQPVAALTNAGLPPLRLLSQREQRRVEKQDQQDVHLTTNRRALSASCLRRWLTPTPSASRS
eukprot:TRINITY_DN69967_c0_g1_i1.p1 TRINITY_DN69967_c0_g1~~TRINITY_DN69967_c0_g1_i1.p1  ORF type:complete len:862 (+),score=280.75 TRINITY_DN69967_c0_g1_i1:118-2586(+)